jgi:zinc/manganese transport system substrate-binding protein
MPTTIRRLAALLLLAASTVRAAPLTVCATITDLGSLVRTIGGDQVTVTVFAKGTEDPHFVEAKPSFLKALSQADLLVLNGLDLEVGWLPALLQNARNGTVLPGNAGYLDASTAIVPLERPTGPVDRSMGDVHPFGNPHYLADPLNGLAVAALIAERLGALRPDGRDGFAERLAALRATIGAALVGEPLAKKYDVDKLAALYEYGKLDPFLAGQHEQGLLGGWLAAMGPHRGAKAVDDHNIWPYFARRFGVDVVGHMEPKPGVPPTTHQLEVLVGRMRDEHVGLILTSAYYDPRHARFVADATGARIVALANQVGARPGTDDYVAMVDYNVRQVVAAAGGGK